MLLDIRKIDTWKASIEDRPGGLVQKLEGLARAGADLEFVIARRTHSRPGEGVVFVSPLEGRVETKAAELGFQKAHTLQALRIEGPDEPGIAFGITRALAADGINLRGVSASRQGNRFLMFLTFDSVADADRAAQRLGSAF